jgi:hypothetical protein
MQQSTSQKDASDGDHDLLLIHDLQIIPSPFFAGSKLLPVDQAHDIGRR